MDGLASDSVAISLAGSPASSTVVSQPTGAVVLGTLSFPLSASAAGTYVARAFFNDGYALAGQSATFPVTAADVGP
jgi:hypothetical protein